MEVKNKKRSSGKSIAVSYPTGAKRVKTLAFRQGGPRKSMFSRRHSGGGWKEKTSLIRKKLTR